MSVRNFLGRLTSARLRLEMLLEACAPALIVRAMCDEPGARQDADRLSAALEGSVRVAEDVLRRSVQ